MSNTEEELLNRLREIVAERAALVEEEYAVVKALREQAYQPVRWDLIGGALGVSRQTAMSRHAQRLADENPLAWQHRRRWDTGLPANRSSR